MVPAWAPRGYTARVRRLLLALLVSGCGTPREVEETPSATPAAAPQPAPRVAAEADPEAVAPPEPEPEPAQARADVPTRARKISSSARPGLIAFADALESDGALWVGQLEGNGGRDTVLFVPPGVRPEQPFDLVVHFHGTYSENIAEPSNGAPKKSWVGWDRLQQTIDAISELQSKRERNVALLYPISAGKRMEPQWKGWSNKMYDRMWMSPVPGDARYSDAFEPMLDQALDVFEGELGIPRAMVDARVTAEGHSAGGIALRNVAASGTRRVEEYIFLDASFQDWADGCFTAVCDQKLGALVTLVITDGGIADPFGKRDPWCSRLEEASRTWPEFAPTCEGKPKRKTGLGKLTCETHEEEAQAWPDYAQWCDAMKDDMADEPGVFVFRTKVPHGKQPRHFVGGLELPADRFGP